MLITVEYVKQGVNMVHHHCKSYEEAHAIEDKLHFDVLRWIAQGGTDAQELAAEAIKTKDIDFDRWCA